MEGYIGDVLLWAPNFVPRNWAFCEGQTLAISQNTALFSLLGTRYGGDGMRTFALPDLRDKENMSFYKGFGPDQPLRYVICLEGLYPMRD